MLLALVLVSVAVGRLVVRDRDRDPPKIVRLAERRLRDLSLEMLDLQRVDDPAAEAALARIVVAVTAPLEPAPADLQVVILDSMVVNAYAFPGDLIVLYAGLIRALEDPEQLAAVIAHELGHVVRCDAVKAIRRQLGLAAVMSVLGGGRSAEVLIQRVLGEVVNLHFSREVEAAADAFALDLLAAAGIDPAALADALSRLQGEGDGPPTVFRYLDSHPDLESRIQSAAARRGETRPGAVREEDWQALRAAL